MTHDAARLGRFLDAQQGTYTVALSEIHQGAKRGHWMWFVFPQLRGLGRSEMAERFGIRSLDEARAYLKHPILGPRLRESVEALQDLTDRTAEDIFGEIDAMKLRSCLTLFSRAGGGALFDAALMTWFRSGDEMTERLLGM